MLQSISWLQFGSFIFISLAVYYGYVLYRFYGREVLAFIGLGKDGMDEGGAELVRAADEKGVGSEVRNAGLDEKTGEAGKAGNGEGSERGASEEGVAEQEVVHGESLPGEGQGVLFDVSAAGQSQPQMFKVMEKVVGLLRVLMNDGAATGVRREELEGQIQQVLGKYRHLLRTPYADTVNHFIMRCCMTQMGFSMTEDDVGRLWGGSDEAPGVDGRQ